MQFYLHMLTVSVE